LEVNFRNLGEKEKRNCQEFLAKQNTDIVFEEEEGTGNFVTHIKFVKSPKKYSRPPRSKSPKGRFDSKFQFREILRKKRFLLDMYPRLSDANSSKFQRLFFPDQICLISRLRKSRQKKVRLERVTKFPSQVVKQEQF
jgi:hypothetical protein